MMQLEKNQSDKGIINNLLFLLMANCEGHKKAMLASSAKRQTILVVKCIHSH